MLDKLKKLLLAPFTAGLAAVNNRPSGGAYRRVTSQLHALPTPEEGKFALAVGHGLVPECPVVTTIEAKTPVEAANAVLAFVHGLKRSDMRKVNSTHCAILRAVNAEKRERMRRQQQRPTEAPASTGTSEPSHAGGQASGDVVILDAAPAAG